jgi:hypothetical protein
MTTVIAFPMGRVKPSGDTLRAGYADVVIFPGVRVERREFNSAVAAPRRKRRSSRARALAAETAAEE